MKLWNCEDLKGEWIITVKIDGVNATWDGGKFVSRRGKPLYNANEAGRAVGAEEGEVYEIFCGSFKETISIVRSNKNPKREVTEFELFDLEPEIDPRLYLLTMEDPTAEKVKELFKGVIDKGYEGLVLRGPNGERLKVKDKITLDLIVLDVVEGKGRNKGRVGALVTSRGKVSGMTDAQREEFWEHGGVNIIGRMIEVECMQLTEAGKMRHARFTRVRDDKPLEESDDA
jgi:DNA ligase-1